MKLTLKPHNRNEYPIGAVFIRDSSPTVWLREMEAIHLSLNEVRAYAIPGDKANELYGCLLITSKRLDSIGKNSYLQSIDNRLFIPEYATIFPAVASEEWQGILKENNFVLLPEIGLFELKETINWVDLIEPVRKVSVRITTPAKSVSIPNTIQSLQFQLDEEALMKELEAPLSEEELIEKLPFDMKKLLNGNQREMEKYLAYIDKNPEMALKLGIPLDVMGTSRGDNKGRFSFSGGFFDNFFGSSGSSGSSGIPGFLSSKAVITVFVVFLLSIFIYLIFSASSGNASSGQIAGKKDLAVSAANDSITGSKVVFTLFIIIMAFVVLKLIFTSSFSISTRYNFRSTVILLILLLISLAFLLYPIYTNEGFSNKLSIIILIAVGILLYRIFNSNKSVLKSDDE